MLKELVELGGYGDVGVVGCDVGDVGWKVYFWGCVVFFVDSVFLGDFFSIVVGEFRWSLFDFDFWLVLVWF